MTIDDTVVISRAEYQAYRNRLPKHKQTRTNPRRGYKEIYYECNSSHCEDCGFKFIVKDIENQDDLQIRLWNLHAVDDDEATIKKEFKQEIKDKIIVLLNAHKYIILIVDIQMGLERKELFLIYEMN